MNVGWRVLQTRPSYRGLTELEGRDEREERQVLDVHLPVPRRSL